MDKESIVRNLAQQALDSGHHLTQLQEILVQNYDQDLQNHPDFLQLWTELQHAFPRFTIPAEMSKVSDKPLHQRPHTAATDDIFHQLQCAVRDGRLRAEAFPCRNTHSKHLDRSRNWRQLLDLLHHCRLPPRRNRRKSR